MTPLHRPPTRRLMAAALLAFGAATASAQVAVVVAPSSTLTTAEAQEIANLFLGRTTQLQGSRAVPVDQADSAPVKDALYARLAGKSAAQVKATWSKLAFSGRATPPLQLQNSDDVKKFVAGHPNAVGYIESSAVDSNVKVLLTLN